MGGQNCGRGEALVFAYGHCHQALMLALSSAGLRRSDLLGRLLPLQELCEAFAEIPSTGGRHGRFPAPVGSGFGGGGGPLGLGLRSCGSEIRWCHFVVALRPSEDLPWNGKDTFERWCWD